MLRLGLDELHAGPPSRRARAQPCESYWAGGVEPCGFLCLCPLFLCEVVACEDLPPLELVDGELALDDAGGVSAAYAADPASKSTPSTGVNFLNTSHLR